MTERQKVRGQREREETQKNAPERTKPTAQVKKPSVKAPSQRTQTEAPVLRPQDARNVALRSLDLLASWFRELREKNPELYKAICSAYGVKDGAIGTLILRIKENAFKPVVINGNVVVLFNDGSAATKGLGGLTLGDVFEAASKDNLVAAEYIAAHVFGKLVMAASLPKEEYEKRKSAAEESFKRVVRLAREEWRPLGDLPRNATPEQRRKYLEELEKQKRAARELAAEVWGLKDRSTTTTTTKKEEEKGEPPQEKEKPTEREETKPPVQPLAQQPAAAPAPAAREAEKPKSPEEVLDEEIRTLPEDQQQRMREHREKLLTLLQGTAEEIELAGMKGDGHLVRTILMRIAERGMLRERVIHIAEEENEEKVKVIVIARRKAQQEEERRATIFLEGNAFVMMLEDKKMPLMVTKDGAEVLNPEIIEVIKKMRNESSLLIIEWNEGNRAENVESFIRLLEPFMGTQLGYNIENTEDGKTVILIGPLSE